MKRCLRCIVVLVALAAVAGGLVLVSGVVPIKASSGHWPITAWLLDFAKRRSVSTHTLMVHAPDLDQPGLVLKGAGHYHFGCAPCHGSPLLHHPVVPHSMTPPPPYLPPGMSEWEPEELFYIVKHGIKFTGMPAWPAENRDDEVWAVVAFLRQLPEMDEQEYKALVWGESGGAPRTDSPPETSTAADSGTADSGTADSGTGDSGTGEIARLGDAADGIAAVVESCAACHGETGRGRGAAAFPVLAGQRPEYLAAALLAFANGERHSGIMKPVANGLTAREITQLARYYGRMDGLPSSSTGDERDNRGAAIARGATIAHLGVPADRIPSCVDCHGPSEGEDRTGSEVESNPHYPILAGQNADYLVLQLKLFKQRARGGSEYALLMHPVADRLNAKQMQDVAEYFASLGDSTDPPE